jgi:hypothetical protein
MSSTWKLAKLFAKKCMEFKKTTIGVLLFMVLGGVGIYADISGLLNRSITPEVLSKENQAQTANIEMATRNLLNQSTESLKDSISGLDCTSTEDATWIKDEKIYSDNQYILLKDDQQVGSIRFYKTFLDTFSLRLEFIPKAIEGINMTISIKDDAQNELGITIGSGDFENYRVSIKQQGNTIVDKGLRIEGPKIKNNEDVVFNLETSKQAESLLATSYIIYTPDKKPDQKIPINLSSQILPYFSNRSISLNIGLRRTKEVPNPKVRIVNCEVHEKNF